MRRLQYAIALLTTAWLGCGGNEPPVLDPLTDQVAFVNTELRFGLHASDPDEDELSFRFASDIADIQSRARIEEAGGGDAFFRWTPAHVDVGMHPFDFVVSDGEAEARQTIAITVEGGSNAPFFVQPLGTGKTVNLETTACADVTLVVEDPDSSSVTIAQEEPLLENAGIDPGSVTAMSALWSFCPSAEQVAVNDRYSVVYSADDGANKTLKNYLIVLRHGTGSECPGEGPVITHSAQDFSTVMDLTITAQISDDLRLKYEPLFYYSLTPPSVPVDVTELIQLTMVLVDGDMQNGTWSVDVPNPVASEPPGSSAQLYYVIVAEDDDDQKGTCDHVVQAPETGTYQSTVQNPGGGGGLGPCEKCTSDSQCGGEGDNCVFIGGDFHCFTACDGPEDCTSPYYCSFTEFTSVDGASARQCIPEDYSCEGKTGGCVDDGYEDNDSMAEAAAKPELQPGTYADLKSCPADGSGDDEDWYRVSFAASTHFDISIEGGDSTDLDLALVDDGAGVVISSTSLTSSESVDGCIVDAGTYYIRVYAYGTGENTYTLTFNAGSCSGCTDDSHEDDDDQSQARPVDLYDLPYLSDANAICSWDDDWYGLYGLFQDETVYAVALFEQQDWDEDLDLYIYDDEGNNLTGCDEAHPFECDPDNGQSTTSDEMLVWVIPEAGDYFIVVHGWDGSENDYDICLSLYDGDCTIP